MTNTYYAATLNQERNKFFTARPDGYKNILFNRRVWFADELDDELDDDLGDTPDDEQPESPASPEGVDQQLEEMTVNFNALDDEGHRLYFDKTTVTDLREESKSRRKELRERESEIERLQNQINERTQADETRRLQELEEQEQFKDLAAEWENKYTDLQSQLDAERFNSLRHQVASEFKLPSQLVERLRGETLEELRQDAESLAELVARDEPPAPSGKQGSTTPAVPRGSGPVGRTDQDRKSEYFVGAKSSGMFNSDRRNIRLAPERQTFSEENN